VRDRREVGKAIVLVKVESGGHAMASRFALFMMYELMSSCLPRSIVVKFVMEAIELESTRKATSFDINLTSRSITPRIHAMSASLPFTSMRSCRDNELC
jgi:hypothetical protein